MLTTFATRPTLTEMKITPDGHPCLTADVGTIGIGTVVYYFLGEAM